LANVLSDEKRLKCLAFLVDGNSVRGTERRTDVNLRTILRLGLLLGQGAQRLHDRMVRDLQCSMIQVDEIWSYVGKKQARVDPLKDGPDVGEAYTFVALDASSRMVISFHVGKRDQASTDLFMADVRARLVVMPAMTSDGFAPYISAIGASFGKSIDYAQTVKNYRHGASRGPDHRYEPPRDPFITKKAIYGTPDLDRASTAYIERNNATMRHVNGRIRRLCYAFSKKLENHKAAVALAYAHYNFCHVVKTLRVTPAMAAGVTDHVWGLEEFMAALLDGAPVAKPTAKQLVHNAPEGPARALPNGRGFLRVVGGKSGPAPQKPGATPPPVPSPVGPVMQVQVVAPGESAAQLDLLAWRPKAVVLAPLPARGTQLSLF
jgi:IS1 family transposase